jgi:Family of unknown function (DUF5335)
METTRQIGRADWKEYFEQFTRKHLSDEAPEAAATVEVVSPLLGDQYQARSARLLGLAYDPENNAFEVLLQDLAQLVFYPVEIWVIEDEAGFLSTLGLVRTDGAKEIIYVRRSGPPARQVEEPAVPPGS